MASIRELQTPDYRKLRDELLEAETALKDQRERVAELRRQLPGATRLVTDYSFLEGPGNLSRTSEGAFFTTRLSELFGDKNELLIQHLMFAPDWEKGCPMCSMWADGLNGIAHHLADRVSFAVVAAAPLAKLRSWARVRGWHRLRLLSSWESPFNADLGAELSTDRQLPGFSVFTRNPQGSVFHYYTTEGSLTERHHRAMDLYTPVWNLLDLLPTGRGDWMPQNPPPEG
jgi:predicted dithiol-disulfide oxidoreductase (DUF899 family)